MKKLYIHGTTQQGLTNIMLGETKEAGPWNVSERDGCSYLWDVEAVMTGEDQDIDFVIRNAFESAQLQAAIKGEDNTLYALVCEFDSEEVEIDFSCENMDAYARYAPESQLNKSVIKKIYKSDFNKWDSPFILSGVINNEHFSKCMVEDSLLTIAETLANSEVYREIDIEWTETEV